jgi:hypothetical protein
MEGYHRFSNVVMTVECAPTGPRSSSVDPGDASLVPGSPVMVQPPRSQFCPAALMKAPQDGMNNCKADEKPLDAATDICWNWRSP